MHLAPQLSLQGSVFLEAEVREKFGSDNYDLVLTDAKGGSLKSNSIKSRAQGEDLIARELELKIYKQNSKAYSQITQIFKCNTVSEALLTCYGVVKTSLLAILAIILPDMRADLQGLTSTPLGETKEEVKSYLEAVIKSGVATNAHREMLYILGNTGAGKTSLTETYKSFLENPDKPPESKLTQDHKELLRTRIAEVHNDAIFPQSWIETIQIEDKGGISLVRLESNVILGMHRQYSDKCYMKIVDFGGHQVLFRFI